MGNPASVSIANITVFNELIQFYKNCGPNMVIRARFVDDLFMIIDITDIPDFNIWLKDRFFHEYLKTEHSSKIFSLCG